ncbi:hypothetical protein GCM10017608_16250 [Agromyces luteolus]|nr:hypothetical protein GCM10017608_16250 [Agromyces luteolus]
MASLAQFCNRFGLNDSLCPSALTRLSGLAKDELLGTAWLQRIARFSRKAIGIFPDTKSSGVFRSEVGDDDEFHSPAPLSESACDRPAWTSASTIPPMMITRDRSISRPPGSTSTENPSDPV